MSKPRYRPPSRDHAERAAVAPAALAALTAAVMATLLAACVSKAPAPAAIDPNQRSVQIQRSAFGVAHIEAADVEALAYGVAYAQAEDNLCLTADRLVTVRGERSRYFGADAAGLLGSRELRNEQIDIYIRGLMDDGELALAASRTSADAQAMARGYVAGYNRFLKDRAAPGQPPLPAPCAGQPWLRPMTLPDYRRLVELEVTQRGAPALADAVVAARLPARDATPPKPVALRDAVQALAGYRLNDTAVSANGWAFGAETSLSGRGLLLANPHQPWQGVDRYWQLHLTVPGQLDAMGASLGVLPLVHIGFNKNLAWTHTPSAGQRFTLHELKLLPDDPARYLVDGLPERMRARTVRYEALKPDGTLETRLHTVWMTRFGPVVALPAAGLNWTAQTAYALQDSNTWNLRGADTWLAINRAGSIAELRSALAQQGTGWVNTLAADREGDVLYADASAVPDLDAAQLQRCIASKPSAALAAAAGLVLLDGSRAECQWRQDASAVAPGRVPPGRMPALERRDWVQNAGDSHWLSNPQLALDGVAPLVGPAGVPQSLRTRAGIVQIQDRLAGKDGLAEHGKVGLDEVQAMLLMNRNHAAALVLDDLLAACAAPGAGVATARPAPSAATSATTADASPDALAPAKPRPTASAPARAARTPPGGRATKPGAGSRGLPAKQTAKPPAKPAAKTPTKPSVKQPIKAPGKAAAAPTTATPLAAPRLSEQARAACAVLQQWDRRDDLDSRGALLFRAWWRQARQLPGVWRVAFSAADPVHTPRGLNTSDARLRGRLFEALEQASEAVQAAGFALDVSLREVQHRQTPAGPVALHGGDEIEGVLNRIEAAGGTGLAPGGLEIAQGSSYLLAVGFDERGPQARGLLTYGQSAQAGGAGAFDELTLFARKQPWPALPFRPEEVAQARVGGVLRLVLEPRPATVAAPNPVPIPPPLPMISASAPPAEKDPPPSPVPLYLPGGRQR